MIRDLPDGGTLVADGQKSVLFDPGDPRCCQAVFTFSIFMKNLYFGEPPLRIRISKDVGFVDQHRKEWGRVDYFAAN